LPLPMFMRRTETRRRIPATVIFGNAMTSVAIRASTSATWNIAPPKQRKRSLSCRPSRIHLGASRAAAIRTAAEERPALLRATPAIPVIQITPNRRITIPASLMVASHIIMADIIMDRASPTMAAVITPADIMVVITAAVITVRASRQAVSMAATITDRESQTTAAVSMVGLATIRAVIMVVRDSIMEDNTAVRAGLTGIMPDRARVVVITAGRMGNPDAAATTAVAAKAGAEVGCPDASIEKMSGAAGSCPAASRQMPASHPPARVPL
jgi:hypothetical protein